VIRAALYARQSLDRTEGIDRQLARAQALAAARGYDVVERYIDNDTSATKDRSRGTDWARMIADATAGSIDVVIAVDVDRLLRSVADLLTLTATGARVLTVDGEVDLTTADGEFRATMLAGIARFEVRRKSERQLRANESRRARGVPTPGRRRYGYETDGVTPRPAEAKVVRRIFSHLDDGGSVRSIALALSAEGIDPAPGRSWSTGRIRYIATNEAYGGGLPKLGGESSVEPLVDPAQAERVRLILADEGRRLSPGPKPRHVEIASAVCGVCGAGLVSRAHNYLCRDEPTRHVSIKPTLLAPIVRDALATALLATRGNLLPDDSRAALGDLAARSAELADAETEARDLRREKLLSADGFRDELRRIAAERERIDAAMETARASTSSTSALIEAASEVLGDASEVGMGDWAEAKAALLERFDALDVDRRRDLVRAFLDVQVDPARVRETVDGVEVVIDVRKPADRVRIHHKIATQLNPEEHVDDPGGESVPRPAGRRRAPRNAV
jgi:site-specific DNA recombinase